MALRLKAGFSTFPGRLYNEETNNDWTDLVLSVPFLKSEDADGAAAVAAYVDTNVAWANAAARLYSWRNNAVEKAYVLQTGRIVGASFGGIQVADIPSLSATYLALAGGTMSGDITLKTASVLTDYGAGKVVISGTTPMFALGGTSSSFPALKRNGAVVDFRLADDSGGASISVGNGAIGAVSIQFPGLSVGHGFYADANWFYAVGSGAQIMEWQQDQVGMVAACRLIWGSGSTYPANNKDTGLARNAAGVVELNNGTVGTFRDIKLRDIYVNGATFFSRASAALTDGAGASVGTLGNAPAAGNPTKWIQIDDNGTTRKIPAW